MTKNKTIVFSDLHIHNYYRFRSGEERLENTLKVVSYIYKIADNGGVNTLLFTGDLMNNQKVLPISVVNRTAEVFKDMEQKYPNIHFYAISGNHDYANTKLYGKVVNSSLEYLEQVNSNFHILDDTKIKIGNTYIFGIPFYEYSEHFNKRLVEVSEEAFKLDGVKILLTHQVPTNENPLIPIELDIKDINLTNFDMVFNGHIHKRERLSDKFLNVGSPIARDADDIGENKGITAFNLATPHKNIFISLNAKFPTIISKTKGEELSEWEKEQFIVETPLIVPDETSSVFIDSDDFKTSLTSKTLLENYCRTINEEDKIIVGLNLI